MHHVNVCTKTCVLEAENLQKEKNINYWYSITVFILLSMMQFVFLKEVIINKYINIRTEFNQRAIRRNARYQQIP
jgi:hypothetical protein